MLCRCLVFLLVFFFFQAEDGIRDLTVTGVQTCALPIYIFQALGAELPKFAHVPMILGADGERLSKRHGAVSVMQYAEDGYLPEALVNYLARLGWSHGDEEMFTVEQFLQWFDLAHIRRSAAQFHS